MFDPGSVSVALGVASSAMSQIKKFYDHGKDLSSMSQEIGKFMSAASEIDEIEKGAKNPTLFRKLVSGKGVEGLAFEAFQAKKKLAEQISTHSSAVRCLLFLQHGTFFAKLANVFIFSSHQILCTLCIRLSLWASV